MNDTDHFLKMALDLAYENIVTGGRPFGAVLVKEGQVVSTGVNEILRTKDPTAHAELLAIRKASQILGSADLSGCTMYASGNPCPMCMAAMRIAGVERVLFAYSNQEGEPYGLSTANVYADLAKPFPEQSMQISHVPVRFEGREDLYELWKRVGKKI